MTYANKKISYMASRSYDMVMRLNRRDVMDTPSVDKIDISISDPSVALNKRNILPILVALELITKQKPSIIKSRGVLQQFNIRKGALIGGKATIKGDGVILFLENLIATVMPKVQNIQSFRKGNISKDGNLNLTFHDPLVFAELEQEFEKFSKVPDIKLSINTTAKTKKEALSLLSSMNIPFI